MTRTTWRLLVGIVLVGGAVTWALLQVWTSRYGGLDVAVANAGGGTSAEVVDHDFAEWRRVVDLCLHGAFLTVKHAGAAMRAAGHGRQFTGSAYVLDDVQVGADSFSFRSRSGARRYDYAAIDPHAYSLVTTDMFIDLVGEFDGYQDDCVFFSEREDVESCLDALASLRADAIARAAPRPSR